jgi:hypothetical protein
MKKNGGINWDDVQQVKKVMEKDFWEIAHASIRLRSDFEFGMWYEL